MEEPENSLKSHLNRFVKSYASSIDFLPLWAAHCDGFTASKLQDVQISLDFDKLNAPTLHQLPPPPLLSVKHLYRRGLQIINDYVGGREFPDNYVAAFQCLDNFLKEETEFLKCLQQAKRQDKDCLTRVLVHHLLSKLVPDGSCSINSSVTDSNNQCLCGKEINVDKSSTAVGVKSLWHGSFDVVVSHCSALVFEDTSPPDDEGKVKMEQEESEPPPKKLKTSGVQIEMTEKNSENCMDTIGTKSSGTNGSSVMKSETQESTATTSSEDDEKSKSEENSGNKVTNIKSLFQIKSPNPSLCGYPNIRKILGQSILNAMYVKKNNPALIPLLVPTIAFTGTEFIIYLYNSAGKIPYELCDVMLYSRCLDLTSKSQDGTLIPPNVVILLWLMLNFDLFGNPIPQQAFFEIARRQYLFGFRRDTGEEMIKYETEIKRGKDLENEDTESSAINFSLVRNIAQPFFANC